MKGYGFKCAQNVTRSAVSGFFGASASVTQPEKEKAAPADWTSLHSLSITSHSGIFRGRQEEPLLGVDHRVRGVDKVGHKEKRCDWTQRSKNTEAADLFGGVPCK